MSSLPPLRRLRATSIILILIVFAYVLHLLTFVKDAGNTPKEERLDISMVFARNYVSGKPFGVDTSFSAGHTRVFCETTLPEQAIDSGLVHIWFRGLDTIARINCVTGNTCLTSVAPEQLVAGDWSVDLVKGMRLLASSQFTVR